MLRQLRNAFIAGLVLLAPLGVTIFVINLLRDKVGAPVSRLLFNDIDGWLSYLFDFVSIFIVILVITILGLLSKYFLGRFIVSVAERIINALPFVNSVYKTVKQIVETFSEQQKAVFQQVVLIEYPRKGVHVLGFLTSETKGEIQHKTDANLTNVFVPTTPNPTSGFLLMVPTDEVTLMEMTVADGMKLIVSGGAVTPQYSPNSNNEPETVTITNNALLS